MFWIVVLLYFGLTTRLIGKKLSADMYKAVGKVHSPPFHNFNDLKKKLQQNKLKLIVNYGSAASLMEQLLHPEYYTAFEKYVLNLSDIKSQLKSNPDLIYFGQSEVSQIQFTNEEKIECNINYLCTQGSKAIYVHRKDNVLLENLTIAILRLRENGLAQHLESKYEMSEMDDNGGKKKFIEYSIPTYDEFLYLPTAVFVFGLIISLTGLLAELMNSLIYGNVS